jgi:hypothetical protein
MFNFIRSYLKQFRKGQFYPTYVVIRPLYGVLEVLPVYPDHKDPMEWAHIFTTSHTSVHFRRKLVAFTEKDDPFICKCMTIDDVKHESWYTDQQAAVWGKVILYEMYRCPRGFGIELPTYTERENTPDANISFEIELLPESEWRLL